MKQNIINVINNVDETGALNGFIENIKNIEVNKNTYVLHFNEEFGRWHHDIVIDRRDAVCYDIMANGTLKQKEGLSLHYSPFYGAGYTLQGRISFTHLLSAIKEIVESNGVTRNTYTGSEGNHKIPKSFERIDAEWNLELCTKRQNSRHYSAWTKVQQMVQSIDSLQNKGQIKLSLSALETAKVRLILHKDTRIDSSYVDNNGDVAFVTLINDTLKVKLHIIKSNGSNVKFKRPDGTWDTSGVEPVPEGCYYASF